VNLHTRLRRALRFATLCILLVLGADPLLRARAPQEPAPEILVFSLVIQGTGSDPKVGAGVSRGVQSWRMYRGVAGWFEVTTKRKKVGRGASAHEQIEIRRPGDGAFAIGGSRRDWAISKHRDHGEGGSYADYFAEETWTRERDLSAPPRQFFLVLDAPTGGEPSWQGMFLPMAWSGELELEPRYAGHAKYEPGPSGGFGEPYDYFADDPTKRNDGVHEIDARFPSGMFGGAVFPLDHARDKWPAAYDGKAITGHVEFDLAPAEGASGQSHVRYILHWSVQAELSDVALEVRSANYERWRPEATLESCALRREPGPPLLFAATLRARDKRSQKPLPKITRMTWRLLDTSSEPGLALNWPYASDDRRPDLELVDGWTLDSGVGAEDQTLVVRPEGTRSEIAVVPFDRGAFATLRVEAELEDGRTIEGELVGVPSQGSPREIAIPYSERGSRIAMSWLRAHAPQWKSDADDLDADPPGKPGVDGDGFTAYEEYRGFCWGGRLFSTEPARKDLFVRREPIAVEAGAGLAHFAELSGLDVHVSLRAEELPQALQHRRVVNVNRNAGATCGPQTALYVRSTLLRERFNDLIRSGSRPANVPAILVPSHDVVAQHYGHLGTLATRGSAAERRQALTHLVVQALFQSCGVDRPGRTDRVARVEWFGADDAQGLPAHARLDGQRVWIMAHEGSTRWMEVPGRVFYFLVGAKGGAHSGPEECVMRDWFADLYSSPELRDGFEVYRFAPAQRPGTLLGTTRRGTGINADSPERGSCFGDSAVIEPASKQLVVKDGAP
jgi:hypothetical protein